MCVIDPSIKQISLYDSFNAAGFTSIEKHDFCMMIK